jgi:hypothetical protein
MHSNSLGLCVQVCPGWPPIAPAPQWSPAQISPAQISPDVNGLAMVLVELSRLICSLHRLAFVLSRARTPPLLPVTTGRSIRAAALRHSTAACPEQKQTKAVRHKQKCSKCPRLFLSGPRPPPATPAAQGHASPYKGQWHSRSAALVGPRGPRLKGSRATMGGGAGAAMQQRCSAVL